MSKDTANRSILLKDLTFTETTDYEKGFSAHFDEKIKHTLEPLENLRIEKLALINKRRPMAIIGIGGTIAIGLWIVSNTGEPRLLVLIGLVVYFIYNWAFLSPKKEYANAVKSIIIPKVASFLGDFTYQMKGQIPGIILQLSRIIPSYDLHLSEDYLSGHYKEVKIELAEAELKDKRSNGKNDTYVTVFKGMLILLKMNKSFNGQTVVKTDAGAIGNWFSRTFNNWDKVKLEDPEFEKKFEVYSTDQVEARYLLTTAFMERFLHLAKIYNSNEIQCSFFDDQIFITIPSKQNLFEPQGPEKSIINTDDIHTFLEQMHSIFQIVDVLKLNQKIGM